MFVAQHTMLDLNDCGEKRLRLGMLAQLAVEHRLVVGTGQRLRMLFAEDALLDIDKVVEDQLASAYLSLLV